MYEVIFGEFGEFGRGMDQGGDAGGARLSGWHRLHHLEECELRRRNIGIAKDKNWQ